MTDSLEPTQETEDQEPALPEELAVVRLLNGVVYPGMLTPLTISNPLDGALIDEALAGERVIALVVQKEPEIERPGPEGLHEYGLAVVIQRMLQVPGGDRQLVIRGVSRLRVLDYTQLEPFLKARVETIPEPTEHDETLQVRMEALLDLFRRIVEIAPHMPEELYVQAMNLDAPGGLADMVATALSLEMSEREQILEAIDVTVRLKLVTTLATRELERLELTARMQADAREELTDAQRQYFLRQHLKAIQEELGEAEDERPDLAELRARLDGVELPEETREAAEREYGRLENMNPAAAEYNVSRTYVEWLLDLPWSESSEEVIDTEHAQKVLDQDHYGLDDVKDRIIEHLAVRKLRPDVQGPILCFVGPPGVGKTSLGKSIARATGREFHRISLGGVRDEAEIRGHRRTYVGALPGRVIQGMRRVGVNNPVFMLDEIDKLGSDFRGDPSSALLEVLDPEQNDSFRDHYLEVPYDLSRTMFITTANMLETIPPALLDRMEVIRIPGYTQKEKLAIAKRFLVPRQRERHGLTVTQFKVTDAALSGIIRGYTREAGVRNLERTIGSLCRKIARRVTEGESNPPNVTGKRLEEFLGPRKFYSEVAERTEQAGVVCGLAWTQAGGEILFIEATRMKGKKTLTLTGQLGEVMQESAQAALSWVRTHAADLGIDEDFFETSDLHLHVPAGAVPKDGPSAGVAMATALASLLTGRPLKQRVAMTGELTLRGKVMPIGGVKEKVLAAKAAGITTVILPERNRNDLAEIPEEYMEGLEIVFASTIDEVLALALTPAK